MKRIKYIDILRAIAIILVIVGHIPYPGYSIEFHKWVYSFHIPLFFFVSGITLTFTKYKSTTFKKLVKKRFHRIYLPFLIWGIMLALPTLSLMTIPKLLYGTHQSIAQVSNSSLWFLPVLFASFVLLDALFIFFIKQSRTKLIITFLFFLLIAIFIPSHDTFQSLLGGHNVPFGLDIVPMAITFMLSGYFFQSIFQNKNIKPQLYISIPIILILLFITIKLGLINNTNYVLMAENRYGDLLNFFTVAISGIIMSIFIALLIYKNTKYLSKIMQITGCDTMTIFIIHKYPLQLINELIMLIPVAHISNYIIIPVYLAFALIVCVPISSFIKKRTPILIGK